MIAIKRKCETLLRILFDVKKIYKHFEEKQNIVDRKCEKRRTTENNDEYAKCSF